MTNSAFSCLRGAGLPTKPRETSLTSILDKSLGPHQVEDLTNTAGPWIDVVKLGWGTSRFIPRSALSEKIRLYREAGIEVCTGGTLLEVAYAQDAVASSLEEAAELGFSMIEVSNGVFPMAPSEKAALIAQAREQGFRVWSEVGKKDPAEDSRVSLEERIRAVRHDLDAGAEKVILEARESGTLGIFDHRGKPVTELIHRLAEEIGVKRLIFEAPRKAQQVWMIRNLGPAVNLANVAAEDALSLATLRTGFRGDTFVDFQVQGLEIFTEVGVHGALAARQRGGLIVLIDALRASGTILAALASGMQAVRPVASPAACKARSGFEHLEITAGERGGRKLPHVHHGNSPSELLRAGYKDKILVLTSSNGVECLLTAADTNTTVLVGSNLNAAAAAAEILAHLDRARQPVTLLMAGRNNQPTAEDSLAAGEILRALRGSTAVRLHGESLPAGGALEAEFFAGRSGRNLVSLGYGEDVQLCAGLDRFDVVGVYNLETGLIVAGSTRG